MLKLSLKILIKIISNQLEQKFKSLHGHQTQLSAFPTRFSQNMQAVCYYFHFSYHFIWYLPIYIISTHNITHRIVHTYKNKVEYEHDGFNWDAKTQAEVLAAFFTVHFATQLPG